VVFRQLSTPEQRAEFTHLMKRAYAQHTSACAFGERSPERQVSAHIRRLCEVTRARDSTQAVHDPQEKPRGGREDGTNFAREHTP
jgi:hypothetical protein